MSYIDHKNNQLDHTSKMAALGEMLGSIAHEINNPLAVITARTQHLKTLLKINQLSDVKLIESIDRIESTAMKIAKIVHNIKNYSRDSDLDNPEYVTVKKIIDDALEFCIEKMKMNNISIDVDAPSEHKIYCRSIQISQVILNLLFNAIDATETSIERWIKISVRNYENNIVIAVVDSGEKISPTVAEQLMTPYFTTKPKGKGLGLGLSISKQIIEAHRGKLIYDSTLSHTCFKILLPTALIYENTQ